VAGNFLGGWWQFSLRTVLWLTLVIGVGLGAHRRGYDAGRNTGFDAGVNDGLNRRSAVSYNYVKNHHVKDLVRNCGADETTESFGNRLVAEIRLNVLPNTWLEHFGEAFIQYYDDQKVIAVSHDDDGQQRVAAFLSQRRAEQLKALAIKR
jgi:hypothetical protein